MTTRDKKPKLRIKLFPRNKIKTEINYATGQNEIQSSKFEFFSLLETKFKIF